MNDLSGAAEIAPEMSTWPLATLCYWLFTLRNWRTEYRNPARARGVGGDPGVAACPGGRPDRTNDTKRHARPPPRAPPRPFTLSPPPPPPPPWAARPALSHPYPESRSAP